MLISDGKTQCSAQDAGSEILQTLQRRRSPPPPSSLLAPRWCITGAPVVLTHNRGASSYIVHVKESNTYTAYIVLRLYDAPSWRTIEPLCAKIHIFESYKKYPSNDIVHVAIYTTV